jgi:hypothetical protein
MTGNRALDTEEKMEKIYVERETVMNGRGHIVWPEDFNAVGEPLNRAGEVKGDVREWGNGTEEELCVAACYDLSFSPARGDYAYIRNCARNVLRHYGHEDWIEPLEKFPFKKPEQPSDMRVLENDGSEK